MAVPGQLDPWACMLEVSRIKGRNCDMGFVLASLGGLKCRHVKHQELHCGAAKMRMPVAQRTVAAELCTNLKNASLRVDPRSLQQLQFPGSGAHRLCQMLKAP